MNGSRPLPFVVDTGASHNVIDLAVAKELGLNVRFLDAEGGAIGAQHQAVYLINGEVHFEMPGAVLVDETAVAMPLEETRACLDRAAVPTAQADRTRRRSTEGGLGTKLAGILGKTLFDAGVVEVDYRRRMLNLYSSGSFRYGTDDVVLPLEVDSGFLFLKVSIESKDSAPAHARLVLDTGAKTALSITRQFAERNRIMPRANALTSGRECGAAGMAMERTLIGELAALRFGPLKVPKPSTVFYEETESRWYDGLLGNDAFRGFKIIVDLPRLQFTLRNR